MRRATLDVSGLPSIAFGPRTTIWWGVVGMLAIEGTMFGLVVATYFYLRQNFTAWPPADTPPPDLLAATVNMTLLLVSIVPMALAHRAGLLERRTPAAIGLAVCMAAGLGAIALRGFEFGAMHCRWDTHAYGSVVWFALGMHLAHLITSTLENVLLAALLFRGPVERKHFVDVTVNAVYWYFVVLAWLPLYVILYVVPRLA